ncbi:MAG: hypothetical protein HPY60_11055 [Candidatus Methanofastidiosum sp.]|nr:hypothetical protein [Methanofastidiosum sp.]
MNRSKTELKKYKCRICGIKTHNPEEICVLCETGITRLYREMIKELEDEKTKKENRKKVKNALATLP